MSKQKISISCDRGNASVKIVATSSGKTFMPFKIPSITMKIPKTPNSISLNGSSWLCGDEAMKAPFGERVTPMTDYGAGKLNNLAVVIAQAIRKINKEGGDFYLDVAVSSPFAGDGSDLDRSIQKEISKLKDGFSVGDTFYRPEICRVGSANEGLILLETNPEFDAVVDMGYGTTLGGYRNKHGQIRLVSSEFGGCYYAVKEMLQSSRFRSAFQSAGFKSAPTDAKVAALLSAEKWEVRGVNFRKLLDPSLIQKSIEQMVFSIKADLRNDDPYEYKDKPKIALLGGSACLLLGVLGEKRLDTWAKKTGIDIYPEQPDYQTALILGQLQKTNPSRFPLMGEV